MSIQEIQTKIAVLTERLSHTEDSVGLDEIMDEISELQDSLDAAVEELQDELTSLQDEVEEAIDAAEEEEEDEEEEESPVYPTLNKGKVLGAELFDKPAPKKVLGADLFNKPAAKAAPKVLGSELFDDEDEDEDESYGYGWGYEEGLDDEDHW